MANPNILSWQSAFWAIVPIALNTMSLPSGKVLGLPSTYSFVLKSSPIVCAASTLDSIARLIVFTWNSRCFSTGLGRWMSFRFEDTSESEDGSFESLRQNKYFTLGLFALGALPQAVKIFASRGTLWIQACCALYLASFCVDGILTQLGCSLNTVQVTRDGVLTNDEKAIPNSPLIYNWIPSVFLASSAILAREILAWTTKNDLVSIPDGPLWWILLTVSHIVLTLGVFLPLFWGKREGTGLEGLHFVILLFYTFTWGTLRELPFAQSEGPWWDRFIIGPWTATVLSFSTVVVVKWLDSVHFSIRDQRILIGLGMYFALLHLCAALFYCRFLYEWKSTYRPLWTNYLG